MCTFSPKDKIPLNVTTNVYCAPAATRVTSPPPPRPAPAPPALPVAAHVPRPTRGAAGISRISGAVLSGGAPVCVCVCV
jgi:hypothetical protein